FLPLLVQNWPPCVPHVWPCLSVVVSLDSSEKERRPSIRSCSGSPLSCGYVTALEQDYQSYSAKVIDSLGVMIYKALDYGLKENEERELSPPLERLIDMMTNTKEMESDPPDEGYEATEDECEEDDGDEELVSVTSASAVSSIQSYRDIILVS
ncbi:hypothetical protein XENOCAPTIV_005163, partial [Xenoophorus captivus]